MAIQWPLREPLTDVGPVSPEPGVMARGTLKAGMATIPLLVYAGTRPGPVLYVQALQHGLELNGCDVMRRLIQVLDPAEIAGTLILVPMANPLAARVHMQSFPYPDRPTQRKINDMNRRWFDGHGTVNAVDQQVEALKPLVGLADACIDLHCHEYLYSCMALTDMASPESAEFALAMGFEVVRSGNGSEGMFGPYVRETLGKIGVTVEMPPLRRVDHAHSAIGFRGVLNALKSMGMLEGMPELPKQTAVFGTGPQKSSGVEAECEGFMSRYVEGGDHVKAGQLVAEIWGPDDFSVVQSIEAPFDSFVTAIGRPPQVWGEPEHDFMNIGDRAVIFTTASEVLCR
ncbi:MAG: hypothetical protein HN742_15780 [Lentisphaerae bacterium]|jgi:uncharacterized protein|nr:hypothetical protein [Lentisphaerota bacterium]MBT4817298.1 hypothetical protein [Lentisphaerota bacterium]MBT5607731.1 hypothetical protein [Lentisphaerota bacterium]MBT7054894.1 hypothetical protein [Lentisphaerota bacterium]MBT7843336.1 hypothetical protein [Lentisphaerota bacterium]